MPLCTNVSVYMFCNDESDLHYCLSYSNPKYFFMIHLKYSFTLQINSKSHQHVTPKIFVYIYIILNDVAQARVHWLAVIQQWWLWVNEWIRFGSDINWSFSSFFQVIFFKNWCVTPCSGSFFHPLPWFSDNEKFIWREKKIILY